jgi:tryptophan-rich sensory protein
MTGLASRGELRMSFLRAALITVPAILLLGTLSGRASNSGYSNAWFAALDKPAAMPPGWAFPVAWTILYILLGLSAAMILHARGARGRGLALGLFAAQMALNFAWSPLFFAAHQVTLALAVIVAMIALTLACLLLFARIRKLAALLLLPYLAWLGFATYLNFEIMRLNPGAETLVPQAASADIAL